MDFRNKLNQTPLMLASRLGNEDLIMQSMLAIFPRIMRYKATNWYYSLPKPAFESGDFFYAVDAFPEYVLPAKRKKRAYISSILSKNEYYRDGPYNRRLFLRVEHGQYILNPLMDLFVGDRWTNVYELLGVDFDAAESGLDVAENFRKYIDVAVPAIQSDAPLPPFLRFFAKFQLQQDGLPDMDDELDIDDLF